MQATQSLTYDLSNFASDLASKVFPDKTIVNEQITTLGAKAIQDILDPSDKSAVKEKYLTILNLCEEKENYLLMFFLCQFLSNKFEL